MPSNRDDKLRVVLAVSRNGASVRLGMRGDDEGSEIRNLSELLAAVETLTRVNLDRLRSYARHPEHPTRVLFTDRDRERLREMEAMLDHPR